jgi:tRNA-Thr(GGU) m(6)t(6)A37 methyltransferase TsaA
VNADDEIRPGEVRAELPADFSAGLYFIGTIRTPWRSRADCPKNPREAGDAVSTIKLEPRYAQALAGLEAHRHVLVLYFMDRARRDLVVQVPRHSGVATGTFALRSPARPNPIAASVVELLGIDGNVVKVRGLDCLDGTPLLDLKPYRPAVDSPDR